MLKKKIRPLNIKDFNPNPKSNCLAFAIGDTRNPDSFEDGFDLDHNFKIEEAFLKKLTQLGYDELPHQIEKIEDALPNEYVFLLFDWTEYNQKVPCLNFWVTSWDYHVARRELDGTWVHKPGWKDSPCEISSQEDWNSLYNEFGEKYVLFALAAE